MLRSQGLQTSCQLLVNPTANSLTSVDVVNCHGEKIYYFFPLSNDGVFFFIVHYVVSINKETNELY